MTETPVRVGIVGVGGIAQMMHLPTLIERSDLFELVGLADIDRSALSAVSARYGVTRCYDDPLALIGEPDVDAILLLASGSQRETAIAALAAGKHVFIEKPLGFGLRAAEDIARAARDALGTVMVGYHKRFDPSVERAREALHDLRDLRHVQVSVLHPEDDAYRRHHALLPRDRRPLPSSAEQVEQRMQARASSELLAAQVDDIAGQDAPLERRVAGLLCYQSLIHDLNLVRHLLGEPMEVLSWDTWRGGLAQSSLTRFANDVVASVTWVSVPELVNYEETVRFIASDGRVTLTFPSPYLRHAPTALVTERMDGESLVVEHHTVSYDEAFVRELCAFHHHIVTRTEPDTSVADALGDARWIQAMLSVKRGACPVVPTPRRSSSSSEN